MKFHMLAALLSSLVCLFRGDSTEDTLFSANLPDSDAEFAVTNSIMSHSMFAPLEDLPMTYGSMTSTQDSTATCRN
jgi:hypothetical protein